MNDNIVSFPTKPEQEERWFEGKAFCISCKHEWMAVAEPGSTPFECPNCSAVKGHWKYECTPHKDTLIRVCQCGNEYFLLTPEGHFCPNCGIYQIYD